MCGLCEMLVCVTRSDWEAPQRTGVTALPATLAGALASFVASRGLITLLGAVLTLRALAIASFVLVIATVALVREV